MTDPVKHTPPQADKGDIAHAVVRAALSAIPVVGGAADELFQLVLTPPLLRRQQEWRGEIADVVGRLEKDQGIKLEDLQANDTFIDTVLHATHIALRNSQKEKREALRNAVLNAATENAPEQSKQQIFLAHVDRFTVWHLRVLKLFDNPKAWAEEHNRDYSSTLTGSLTRILGDAYPELAADSALRDQIWNDLFTSGLVGAESLHGMMTTAGMMASRTSPLGKEFLRFIEAPPVPDNG